MDITDHHLVPDHSVLTERQKQALLKRTRAKEDQLPRIMPTDPIARIYGLEYGQVLKVVRNSETAGRYVSYRIML